MIKGPWSSWFFLLLFQKKKKSDWSSFFVLLFRADKKTKKALLWMLLPKLFYDTLYTKSDIKYVQSQKSYKERISKRGRDYFLISLCEVSNVVYVIMLQSKNSS